MDVVGVVTHLVPGVAQFAWRSGCRAQCAARSAGGGKEEDREGQVEVEERGELKERRTCTWMTSDETQT